MRGRGREFESFGGDVCYIGFLKWVEERPLGLGCEGDGGAREGLGRTHSLTPEDLIGTHDRTRFMKKFMRYLPANWVD